MKKNICRILLGWVLVLCFVGQAHALLLLRLNLEQLTAMSDRIFSGECISIRSGEDVNGLHVRYVTFRVTETLKGPEDTQITFKQISAPEGGVKMSGIAGQSAFAEMPRYQVGQSAVVFLSGESEIGLTSPVGLHQGLFSVTESGGQSVVVNGFGNKGLMLGMKKSPKVKALSLVTSETKLLESSGQPLAYTPFISLVKKLVEVKN